MITALVYWISCKYKKEHDVLYFVTLCLDIRLIELISKILNK